ncbi:MAG: disulfide oxidoreductase, partial [Rhodobacteraceae bacterium]|nr:disulfide oxidoreductase [Paracoccaceae bacterium]
IDMLERLADMLRAKDSRGGFEATPDMLSITGMTLDQFANLMQGLGYRAERGEREKLRPVVEVPGDADAAPADDASEEDAASAAEASEAVAADPAVAADQVAAPVADPVAEPDQPENAVSENAASDDAAPEDVTAADSTPDAEADADAEAAADVIEETAEPVAEAAPSVDAETAPEIEHFYTFTWAPKRRPNRQGQPRRDGAAAAAGDRDSKPRHGHKPRGEKAAGDRPKGDRPHGDRPQGGKHKGKRPPQKTGAKTFSARPPKAEKPIDPDNPFAAALMGLRDKT